MLTSAIDQQRLAPYLRPGERILWSGRPRQGIAFRGMDIFLVPFSLLWGGFAIFWEASAIASGAPFSFVLVGAAFVLVGLYMTVGRFLHDAAIRRRQLYAVTDQRVLTLETRRLPSFTSLDLKLSPALKIQEHRDGTGSISFDNGPLMFGGWRYNGFELWVPSLSSSPRFFRIPRAREVYRLINGQPVPV